MAKQKTGGQKKGTPNKITTDVRAEGTTRAAPAAAPSAGGLGPQYFGLRTMVLQERRTPVQCQFRTHTGSKLLGQVFRQRTPLNNPRQGNGHYNQADGEDVQRTHMSAEK